MVTTSEEFLNNFMDNKNKEALGEKVEKVGQKDDNFMPDEENAKQSFTAESISKDTSDAYLTARRILNMLVTLPLFIAIIGVSFYILLKAGPFLINFIKGFFIKMV